MRSFAPASRFATTGAVAVGTGAVTPGTVIAEIAGTPKLPCDVVIEHPTGTMQIRLEQRPGEDAPVVYIVRTARRPFEGKVLVRDLLPKNIPGSVINALKNCTPTPEPDEPQIDPWWGEPGLSAAEKVYAWNTFEILAFRTGNPDNPVNAIPGKATATVQIRFVAGTDANTFIPILRKHLDDHGYQCIEISMARKSFMQATRLDPDNAWVRWAAESIRRTTGNAPAVLPNIGGSLPNDCFAETLGLPTLWVPHSYAGCSQHAPNEHALGSVLREGLQMMTGLFWDLGEQGLPLAKKS